MGRHVFHVLFLSFLVSVAWSGTLFSGTNDAARAYAAGKNDKEAGSAQVAAPTGGGTFKVGSDHSCGKICKIYEVIITP